MYAFYPLLLVIFGLGDFPQIAIGFLLAVMAVIINTLNGLDRVPPVLLKTARVHRLGLLSAALRVRLPYAAPYVFTGFKLAVAYSFIGVVGAEFITSSRGIGYEISFAYNNFDNAVMYAMILFILLLVITRQHVAARLGKAAARPPPPRMKWRDSARFGFSVFLGLANSLSGRRRCGPAVACCHRPEPENPA